MKSMMKKRPELLLWVALLSLGLSACGDEPSLGKNSAQDGDYVCVTIDVNAVGHTPMTGMLTTKAGAEAADDEIVGEAVAPTTGAPVSRLTRTGQGIDDPADAADTKIMNLWVLQYDGEGDDAKLIGTPLYIADYQTVANRTAKLVASTHNNTIVFLANTFDNTLPFQQNSTIADLKGRRFTTQSLDKIVTVNPNTKEAGGTFPTDGDYYQRLNGTYTGLIEEGGTLTSSLQHNVCRISVNVTNNTSKTTYPVTLTSADIENVPGCVYFFTDYTGYSSTGIGKPTTNDIDLYGLKNYTEVITWAAGEGTSGTKNAKLYIPANESGIVASNTSPKLKSLFAPSRSTKLRIHGTYQDGGEQIPVTYTFALGQDLISNYQLVPNGDYVYNITLNARGDKATDGRVSYGTANGVDYTDTAVWPLSNCYICNPPSTESATATYKIPVARVDQFWGGGNYENVPNNCLASGNTWTVSVLWSDMPVNNSNFILRKATGTGKDDYFEVQIPGTCVKGNVVLGIKNAMSGDNWLWSWHLWVTDYCPDEAKYLEQQGAFVAGTDTYHITGGDVQRYQAAASGQTQKVYMDRCIGALSPTVTGYARGTLYYQYGRKDPFPGNSEEYYEDGVNKKTYVIATKGYNQTGDEQPRNVPYSVKNPTTFITNSSTYWTYDDKYNPASGITTIVWQDPSASENGNKSIFDPSPSGWKVTTNHAGLSSKAFSGGYQVCNTAIISGGGTVTYPAHGYRNYSSGALGNGSSIGYYWSSSPSDATLAYGFSFISGNFNSHDAYATGYRCSSQRASGKPVRPVQE